MKYFLPIKCLIVLCFIVPNMALPNNLENGAQLYLDHGCYSCHGYNGTGRYPIANNVSGIMTNQELFIIFLRLRADLNPMTPSNSMPNYSADVISDEQAQDLFVYIKTLTDNPPEIEDISVLKNILDNANRIN
jgi:mono/diheme cytochrome c family protein|tara:strand:+ start:11857 stop:12255 length:399 start_codon:yes stop_codon:yes gene_type:complete